jgi:hypothetical protein
MYLCRIEIQNNQFIAYEATNFIPVNRYDTDRM